MIYVTVMSYGRSITGDNDSQVVYAGADYNTAKSVALNFNFPSVWNNFGYVQHWENGTLIKNEEVC